MNKRVVRRLLETFFRRWWLYLLPVALFTGVGMLKAVGGQSGFESAGVVDVSEGTLLSELTSIRGENFGYETPATVTARTMNSLLRTDQFISAVAKSAGVTEALDRGEVTILDIRQSIIVAPDGDTLLTVVARTPNPSLSARLAKATIDSFIDYSVNDEVSESKAAESFFETQLETYGEALSGAEAALADYASTHPGGPEGDRPLGEQIEIQRLRAAVDQAQTQFTTAEQRSEEARLATEQARADATQRIRMVDEPQIPAAPVGGISEALVTVVIFTIVGALLTLGAVVLGTFIDRSLRSADDVEQLLGLTVLAAVPTEKAQRGSRRSAHRRQRVKADTSQESEAPARPARTTVVSAGAATGRSARQEDSLVPARSDRARRTRERSGR